MSKGKPASKKGVRNGSRSVGIQVALVMLLLAGWLGYRFSADQKQVFLPGTTSDGHHVLEEACGACHGGFEEVLNESCTDCHQMELAVDTHPVSTFLDPRWAADLKLLDARRCVTCHGEHHVVPRGVTVAASHCFPCHDDVVEKRATHADLEPASCADAGCHNYHDNRALSPAFLERREGQPDLLPGWAVPALAAPGPRADAALVTDTELRRWPGDAGSSAVAAEEQAWAASAHAAARVGCGDCHGEGVDFQVRPAMKVCGTCHEPQEGSFFAGKHGARTGLGLSPLTPALARRPMKPPGEGQPEALSCGACHEVHRVDTRQAATEACLGCHDDAHSRTFAGSPHARLGTGGAAGPGEREVTCATCHLPRQIERTRTGERVWVNHNNSFTLAPLDRMARLVCNQCHGFELSLTSVLDAELSLENYRQAPEDRHETFLMISRAGAKPRAL